MVDKEGNFGKAVPTSEYIYNSKYAQKREHRFIIYALEAYWSRREKVEEEELSREDEAGRIKRQDLLPKTTVRHCTDPYRGQLLDLPYLGPQRSSSERYSAWPFTQPGHLPTLLPYPQKEDSVYIQIDSIDTSRDSYDIFFLRRSP